MTKAELDQIWYTVTFALEGEFYQRGWLPPAQSAAPAGGNTCYVERSAVRMIMLAKHDELGLRAVDELKIYTAEDFVALAKPGAS